MRSAPRIVLASVHFSLAFMLLISGLASALGQSFDTYQQERAERTENRFTKLESAVASIAEDMHNQRDRGRYDWLQQLCLGLLVTERGVDVARRRKQKSLIEEP